MDERESPPIDAVFHALSDATRRRMLRDLAAGEQTVSDLAKPHAMSLAAASKHIKALEKAGLVQREIRWRTHWLRLNPAPMKQAFDEVAFYERFWTDRLDALARLLADDDQHNPPRSEG